MKQRKIADQMRAYLRSPGKKIIFLWGPRQVGKSTILEDLQARYHGPLLTFDDLEDMRLFVPESSTLQALLRFRTDDPSSRYVFIDEIQKHPDATAVLKLLADTTDRVVVATGSSELRAKTHTFDALTGRFTEFFLYPLTIDEYAHFTEARERLVDHVDPAVAQHLVSYLEAYMIYGGYPHVALTGDKIGELQRMARTSIVKDVVDIYNLRNTTLVYDLLRMLALQIGNLVNVAELANTLKTTKPTVVNYLDILVKNHIIRFLEPYKTNARRAIAERRKVYFVDMGIRNALIDDFRPMHLRQDAGAVFENTVVIGALRQMAYAATNGTLFFYREHTGREVDMLMQSPVGEIAGFEIKWGSGKIIRPITAPVQTITRIGREESIRFLL